MLSNITQSENQCLHSSVKQLLLDTPNKFKPSLLTAIN